VYPSSSRCRAMPRPMAPRPMKATFCFWGILVGCAVVVVIEYSVGSDCLYYRAILILNSTCSHTRPMRSIVMTSPESPRTGMAA
jgi:hypothetical protein